MKISFSCKTIEDLPEAAEILTSYFKDEQVFAFYGDMGAGKTTFIRAICKELGVKDNVSSPTYSLVNEYLNGKGMPVYHFDFYRIKSQDEAIQMGFDDYLNSSSRCLIEWPEKIQSLLPSRYVRVKLKTEGELRKIDMEIVSL